ncbi:MAG: ACT domain-containing protein [Firmicutes bacterium]|nr:ACT domain-containing protein [Bacillota bacterium]
MGIGGRRRAISPRLKAERFSRNRMETGQEIIYQGMPGAFSEAAIFSHWPNAQPKGLESFADVVENLVAHPQTMGLLPIENAYRGSVYDVLDLLGATSLKIWGEVVQPVHLALMVPEGMELADVRRVWSHPQALMQSRSYWSRYHLVAEAQLDTAGSAREVARQRPAGVAAIASPRAADIYGLKILAQPVEDHPDNRTRFWLVSAQSIDVGCSNTAYGMKTSVLFDLPDVPGSLSKVLSALAERNLNLSKVETRPRPGKPFAYRFWIDVIGPEDSVQQVIQDMALSLEWWRVLGTYPICSR